MQCGNAVFAAVMHKLTKGRRNSLMAVLTLIGMSEPDGVVATAPATAVDLDAVAMPLAASTEGATRAMLRRAASREA